MQIPTLLEASIQGSTWLSRDGLRDLVRRDRAWVAAVAGGGILIGLVEVVFMLAVSYRSIFAAGLQAGRPETLMFSALVSSWVFIFATSVPLALSVFYYSGDLRMLCALPVHPLRIVAAKGILLYLYSAPITVLFLAPALWIHFAGAGASAAAVASAVLGLAVFPLLPLSLGWLAALALAKSGGLSRFRTAFEAAGMVVGIALLVGLQVVLVRSTMSSLGAGDPGAQAFLPSMFAGMMRALPPAAWAASGFAPARGAWGVLLSAVVSLAGAAGALALVSAGFVRDVTERGVSGTRRRKAVGAADASAALSRAPRGVIGALVGRELSILASSSAFLFEAAGECLVLPLVLGIYSLILPRSVVAPAMGFMAGTPLASQRDSERVTCKPLI